MTNYLNITLDRQ